jgi:sigma-B regulation protein RsbU (phosphoserine phosphatase)
MLGRVSVAVTYPILLLALVCGVALLLGRLAVSGAERISNSFIASMSEQATEHMRLAIIDHLVTPRRLATLNADRIARGLDDPSDVEALVPTYAAQLIAFETINAVLVCNSDLATMWVERTENDLRAAIYLPEVGACVEWKLDAQGQLTDERLGSYPYDPTTRPWYQSARESGGVPAWTELYEWASTSAVKTLGLGRGVQIPSGPIIDVGLSVNELTHELGRIKVSPNGHVFIMEVGGRFVASARGAMSAEEQSVIRSAVARLDLESVNRGDQAVVLGPATMPDGTQYFIDAERLDIEWAPNWLLITAIPEADLLGRVWVIRSEMFTWGIALVVVAGVVGVLLARSIVRPIVALRAQARAIRDGDLESTFEGSGGLEFTALVEDLNSMRQGLKERLEMRASLAVAMEVQQNLLPQEVPASAAIDVAAFSTYCDETGGDYYDFPEHATVESFGDGSLLVVIGDVTGHGIGAALIMATARAAIRTRLLQEGSLGAVLSGVNEVLAADMPGGRFMTLLAMTISPDGSVFRWASAGHDPPIVFNGDSRMFSEPDGGDVPLGIIPDVAFQEYEWLTGPAGSIVVLGTDGIWETASPSGELYGKDRLRAIIAHEHARSCQEIGEAIVEDLDAFRESDRPLDDVTLIVWKRRS